MEDLDKKIFAERLKFARKTLRNLTLEELTQTSGIAVATLSHLENINSNRKPSFANLIKLSVALEVSVDYLLGNTDKYVKFRVTLEDLCNKIMQLPAKEKEIIVDMIENFLKRNKK